jgi:hypothetical protein
MADRYWVGGSGSWNSTTKWSATSGGSSGASVPTAADNAIFNANSIAGGTAHYVVTVTDNATCNNLTFTPVPVDGETEFNVGNGFVIAGTFSTSGTQGNRRMFVYSGTESLQRDVQIASIGAVSDVDFRDIRITGTGGTLTGTRIGDMRGNSGITFSAPKNCFRIGAGSWLDDQWSGTSGGTPSTDFYPLAQDTAVFDQNTAAGSHIVNVANTYTGSVDMSARTSALTLTMTSALIVCGNWTFGSGITYTGSGTLFFSGRNTQVITSAGKTFTSQINVNSFGGTVELASALSMGGSQLTITAGTFDTKNYSVTAATFYSTFTSPRVIRLGSSTVTISSSLNFTIPDGLVFDAGTSLITMSAASPTFNGGGKTFYRVTTGALAAGGPMTVTGNNTFFDLTLTAPAGASVANVAFYDDQTVTRNFTVSSGGTAVRRVYVKSIATGSPVIGITRTITVGSALSANNSDFQDITIAGSPSGTSPLRAGDCGGNSGITFPAAKTVYWNLAGTQQWTATAWATSSGGAPSLNNFPLAQDTAVFDDAGAAGTITASPGQTAGSIDMSARTSAMTINLSTTNVHGSFSFGTGVTNSSSSGLFFKGRGTSTITSNGVAFNHKVTIDCWSGTVQLADAIAITGSNNNLLSIDSGVFDAVTYNVTAPGVSGSSAGNINGINPPAGIRMGSGLWTLTGSGTVWNIITTMALDAGTSEILLSSTTTSTRTFTTGGMSYPKITIGDGPTSTVTFNGGGLIAELASNKTAAHTIAFGTSSYRFGKWSVSGSAGNVVTLTGTSTTNNLTAGCSSGIDYLDIGAIRFSSTSVGATPHSYGEFYAGANSVATGTVAAPNYLTDKPADSVRYWVGGGGSFTQTTHWSETSGGASGASVPRSHDDIVLDANSHTTSYTFTLNNATGGVRCKSLTIDPPAAGTVTLAGTADAPLYLHGSLTFPLTNMNRLYTGQIRLCGEGAGKTLTLNGKTLGATVTVDSPLAEWALGSAFSITSFTLNILSGSFDTAGYTVTAATINSLATGKRAISLGASLVTLSGTGLSLASISNDYTTHSSNFPLSFDGGTAEIRITGATGNLSAAGQTFHTVWFFAGTNKDLSGGSNTFTDLTFSANTTFTRYTRYQIFSDQTITGTLTFNASSTASSRALLCSGLLQSGFFRSPVTLTCAAVSAPSDFDFMNIIIAGAAVSGGNVTGTRLGDCGGNSGITFETPKTVYWNRATGGTITSSAWALTSGGTANNNNFPLPQDIGVFENTGLNSGATVSNVQNMSLPSIDMSARTFPMTFNGATTMYVFGDWLNGSGTTLSGTGTFVFSGRGKNTNITGAGKTFTQALTVELPDGSLTLLDAVTINRASSLVSGTLDLNGYNLTCNSSFTTVSSGTNPVSTQNTIFNPRILAVGSGTFAVGTAFTVSNNFELTFTGTGTISMTSGGVKNFTGQGSDFGGLILNQGGAGELNILNSNTFGGISNTRAAVSATSIDFLTNVQTVASFTASGQAGRLLTLTGTSATAPGTFMYTGVDDLELDYLILTGIRAYQI